MSDNVYKMSDYQEAPTQPQNRGAPLKPGGGGDNSDGMDPWQQTVETRLGELRADVRSLGDKLDSKFLWLMGAFGAGFIALAGMMMAGYLRLSDAISLLADKLP